MRRTWQIMLVSVILIIASLSAALPTFAGTTGRKNTAIALTAATVYSAFQKNKTAAVILALGTAQAWKNYEDSRKRDARNQEHWRWHEHRYYRQHRSYREHRPHGHAYGYYRHHEDRD